MGDNLFVLNVKQPLDTCESALTETATQYLKAQDFTGAGTYWSRGKAEWFEIGGGCRGILQAAAAGVTEPEKCCGDPKASPVVQYNGEPNLKVLLEDLYSDGDYHDIRYNDDICALEVGDWLVVIDYHY